MSYMCGSVANSCSNVNLHSVTYDFAKKFWRMLEHLGNPWLASSCWLMKSHRLHPTRQTVTTRCLFSVENIDKTHQFQSIYLLLSNIFSIYLHIYLILPEIIAANSGGTSEQSMPFQENRPFWPMTSTFRSVTKNLTASKCLRRMATSSGVSPCSLYDSAALIVIFRPSASSISRNSNSEPMLTAAKKSLLIYFR